MRLTSIYWLFCLVTVLPLSSVFSQTATFPPGFAAVRLATGLDPVAMALAPDGRLFIAEKFGRVMILENGQLRPEPFLEIEVDIFSERGLLGIAFDPDFEQNQYIYLYFTVKDSLHNRVIRVTADGNFAAPGSEVILLDLDPLSGPYHNAGAMVFGADAKLYIAAGDGTNFENAQSLNTLLGKILRINPDGSIPADNPFFNETSGKYRAIWTLGHRNPFAMTVQPGSGRIFTTDVGSDKFEEVNEIIEGKNYGWPLVEGFLNGQTPPDNYQDPLYAYDHGVGCAAVGVATYNPAQVMFPPEYEGKLFFTDHCKGKMWSMDIQSGNAEIFASNFDTPLGLMTAPDGSMYLLDRAGTSSDYATSSGSVWQIFYTGSDAPFISIQPQPALVPVGENIPFFLAATGAEPFSFQWQKNGADIPGATSQDFVFENPALTDSGTVIRCIVTNALGTDTSQAALLGVTSSHRPEPVMLSPADGAVYRAGETLVLKAEAFDEEDGQMPPTAFRWRVDFHHDDHSHPAFGPVSQSQEEFFQIPQVTEVSDNVWYNIVLSVTDLSGLSRTITREILPVKSDMLLRSEPPGFPIYVDSHRKLTPDTVTSVVGVFHQIAAPKSHIANDSLYLFQKWAPGETENSLLLAPPGDGLTLTAIYEAALPVSDGIGLKGQYFDRTGAGFTFDEPFLIERIDSTIDFEWRYNSPDLDLFGHDDWLVRWEGALVPFFDEMLNFHVYADDGIRLWLDEKMLIDSWYTTPNREHDASLFLKGGVKYPIRVEYFEDGGFAALYLRWSSERLERDIIPASQLFPEYVKDTVVFEKLNIEVRPNPVTDVLSVIIESPETATLDFQIFTVTGKLTQVRQIEILPGLSTIEMNLKDYPSGEYFLKISSENGSEVFKISKL